SKTVSFNISPEDLKFYDEDLNYDWEAGEFDIMIGTCSADVQTKRVNWEK
ncbi:MAG: fibronectin type III-like domain-contianing protein, partial [Cloacibacterium sp.]|nr:fibronectin type III-like domain-contianing protein [Cloacibacterium sp.]